MKDFFASNHITQDMIHEFMDYERKQHEEEKRLQTFFRIDEDEKKKILSDRHQIKANARHITEIMCREIVASLKKTHDDYDYSATNVNDVIDFIFKVNDMPQILSEYMKNIHNEIQRSFIPNRIDPPSSTNTHANAEEQTNHEQRQSNTNLSPDFEREKTKKSSSNSSSKKRKAQSITNAKKRFKPTPGTSVYVKQSDNTLEEYVIFDARQRKKSDSNQNVISVNQAKALQEQGKLIAIFDQNQQQGHQEMSNNQNSSDADVNANA